MREELAPEDCLPRFDGLLTAGCRDSTTGKDGKLLDLLMKKTPRCECPLGASEVSRSPHGVLMTWRYHCSAEVLSMVARRLVM